MATRRQLIDSKFCDLSTALSSFANDPDLADEDKVGCLDTLQRMLNEYQRILKSDAPHYNHCCEHCTFLGSFLTREGEDWVLYDLYYCPLVVPTIIARYGDNDYTSGLGGQHPAIIEGIRRAKIKNLTVNSGETDR